MAKQLLEKEEEYRKLNEELQKRNKILMEEFDNVIKKQDNLLKESQQINKHLDYTQTLQKSKFHVQNEMKECKSFVQTQAKYFDLIAKENCEGMINKDKSIDGVPESVDQMGVKGMTSFYRAKIKAMQQDFDKLQLELKTKGDEVKKIQKEMTKASEEKDKWFQAYNLSKANISKLENQVSTLTSKFQSKDNENASLKKEIDVLKKNFKTSTFNVSSTEVRLNRALEESEKIKNLLKLAKQEEKDIKESYKKELQEATNTIKSLEKQKTELLHGFQKQLQLIDNLKKQKTFIEALKLAQISETEFMKLLDWKFED